jgi:hypothetical protein
MSEDRLYLAAIFKHEVRALERMLGWDCSNWLDSAPSRSETIDA